MTTATRDVVNTNAVSEPREAPAPSVRVEARDLRSASKEGAPLLSGVSLSIEPGSLVAIVGGSGAGKTTLLEALAGVRPADQGRVRFDGVDVYDNLAAFRHALGYVPQEDIIHAELSLAKTLHYAARLRLPASTTDAEVERAVADALHALDLEERADVRVSALSGGQRKRASIAVELLTRPRVFFLDEPTSGLDPATGAELLRLLRRLSDAGATVVFTTHAVQDLAACDSVVFLAKEGNLAFSGTPAEAHAYFEVESVERIYERLVVDDSPAGWADRFRERAPAPPFDDPSGRAPAGGGAGAFLQWWVLTKRTFETIVRNRLTMAILLGSPAMVVMMFAILFRPGAFSVAAPEPSAIVMILFWVSFGAFFFGLTYGLLQICQERAILRREHLVGLRLGSYLFSKIAVLGPFLLFVDVLMLAVLRALGRLPAASARTYLSLGVTLALDAVAALALGLLTSAAVSNPSQATLALPMLCFPAVLFSGAILAVHIMARAGQGISLLMVDRWAFEALGHDLGVRRLLLEGGSPLGPPLVKTYGSAASFATGTYWAILGAFALIFGLGAWAMLRRACRQRRQP